MSKLIVVSNRVGNPKAGASAGGLVVGVGDAIKENGGVWFGWNGNVVDDDQPPEITEKTVGKIKLATTDLTQSEYDSYYVGFSNQVLWPVFHYRVDLAEFRDEFLRGYRKVNRRLAEQLRAYIEPGDTIWVHDFHLIPLGAELRSMGVNNPIGFFLHIPLPPTQIMLTIPQNMWLMRSLFSYDLIGFQSSADFAHFRRYLTEEAGGIFHGDGLCEAFRRRLIAKALPIGVDVKPFRSLTQTREAGQIIERQRQRNLGRTTIIGVERLDYSKGLPQRFLAFERMLERYPENHGKCVFTQIAPPTRENVDAYSDIRIQLEQISGAVNGRFGDFDWTPIRYIHRPVARRTLAAMFASSGVCCVTPLRDGMNLVAKEYVVAQEPDDPGVLVLSRFAGAAETLTEALIVNPHDLDEVAKNLQLALTMPLEERQKRHASLLAKVEAFDSQEWARTFLADLAKAAELNKEIL